MHDALVALLIFVVFVLLGNGDGRKRKIEGPSARGWILVVSEGCGSVDSEIGRREEIYVYLPSLSCLLIL
jgi:hypothetical protein